MPPLLCSTLTIRSAKARLFLAADLYGIRGFVGESGRLGYRQIVSNYPYVPEAWHLKSALISRMIT